MPTQSMSASSMQLHVLDDEDAGLSGVIALHSSALGPAAGGCRLWDYADDTAATVDAERLAEGMSYKNAIAGLPLGGGKAVLRRPRGAFDRTALFRAFGQAVERLGGRYVTAEDVGTTVDDMTDVAGVTRHVAGLPARGGAPGGNPSPWTARGVFVAMRRAAERHLGRELADCTVAIQGVGHVGSSLAMMLHEAGARLIVADVNSAAVARVAAATGADVASVTGVLSARADIVAPCALGGVLNEASIPKLVAKLVCGAANNQLGTPEDGLRLTDRDILFAPDYVVNAGGIINVAAEYLGWDMAVVQARVDATGDRLIDILNLADAQGMAANEAADTRARDIIARAGRSGLGMAA